MNRRHPRGTCDFRGCTNGFDHMGSCSFEEQTEPASNEASKTDFETILEIFKKRNIGHQVNRDSEQCISFQDGESGFKGYSGFAGYLRFDLDGMLIGTGADE